eukprot:1160952-Pelagomonas_calceolata.AAC.5
MCHSHASYDVPHVMCHNTASYEICKELQMEVRAFVCEASFQAEPCALTEVLHQFDHLCDSHAALDVNVQRA